MTICGNETCDKKATFNMPGLKAKFCAKHKTDEMVDVLNKKCKTCNLKQPRWNYTGLKSEFCGDCKLEGMIEPNRKLCSCNSTRPSFNLPGLKAEYCNACKSPDMINVIDARCVCGKITSPNFNFVGLTGKYCFDCKLENMVDVRNPMCPCGVRPNFNYGGLKPKFCAKCKLDDMIDLTHNLCIVCHKTQPNFNYVGLKAEYCKKCKLVDMVDTHHHIWCFCGTTQSPLYNLEGLPPRYCSSCKLEGMVDTHHKMCKTHLCNTRVLEKYDGYCLRCYINIFPDKPVAKNYKTKEFAVVEYVKSIFPNVTWFSDKIIKEGCSKRRPDILLDLGYQIIIIEVDENQHIDYDCSCENKRIMELSQDLGHRPIVFIRFNPDEYVDSTSQKITSCWGINKSGICVVKKTHKKEWTSRLDSLREQINYWMHPENMTNKTIETIQLYYDYSV
jgi:hypothetical protein